MTRTRTQIGQALHFAGLDAPLALTDADALPPLIRHIMPHWPYVTRDLAQDAEPFLAVTGTEGGAFECVANDVDGVNFQRDPVDCVCKIVADAAWEQIRSNPLWLCLHCAAVEFAGRLVLIPNKHRAGKSTLSAILAARGYKVFTDDFLPVEVGKTGEIRGRANGVAPRIRLPLPQDFSPEFQDWVKQNSGPQNKRYKYLDSSQLPEWGTALPIGAVVILDRVDSPVPASLSDASSGDTMDVLIRQNFARILHSGRILQASQGVTETAELYRLNYFSAEDAADILERHFETWQKPVREIHAPENLQREPADIALMNMKKPRFDASAAYMRAKGATEVNVDGSIYVSDPGGLGIQKLNPISAAIWRILGIASTAEDVAAVLMAAFPEVVDTKIRGDVIDALAKFAEKGLIGPSHQMAMAAQ